MVHEQPLRLALIGCGEIGAYHVSLLHGVSAPKLPSLLSKQGLSQAKLFVRQKISESKGHLSSALRLSSSPPLEATVVGLMDTNPQATKALGDLYGIEAQFTDAGQMLRDLKPHGVLICTPPGSHREYTELAAKAGVHVFCEKPMAMTLEDADAMISACKTAGVILNIGYVLRYSSEREHLKEKIRSLGSSVFYREIYSPRSGPHQPWVQDALLGGGVLYENSHFPDYVTHVFGMPKRIFAQALRCKPGNLSALDSLSVNMEFSDGSTVLFSDSYALPGYGWEKTFCRPQQVQLEVLGEKGTLQYPNAQGQQILSHWDYSTNEIEHWDWTSDWGANGYQDQLKDFIQSIKSHSTPKVTGEHGRETLRLIQLIALSAQTKKVIEVP